MAIHKGLSFVLEGNDYLVLSLQNSSSVFYLDMGLVERRQFVSGSAPRDPGLINKQASTIRFFALPTGAGKTPYSRGVAPFRRKGHNSLSGQDSSKADAGRGELSWNPCGVDGGPQARYPRGR